MSLVDLIIINWDFTILACDAAPGQVLLAVPEEFAEALEAQAGGDADPG
jgi:hypothetical protein